MASVKITELSSSDPLTGSEVLPIVQGNETVKASVNEISNYIRPYKVFTAIISQNGLNAPSIDSVLENTLGYTVSFSRVVQGVYETILPESSFKTTISCTGGNSRPVGISIFADVKPGSSTQAILNIETFANYISGFISNQGRNDFLLSKALLEIRVYN
jgi:hypothetical protein